MKNILFILLFLPLFVTAQTTPVGNENKQIFKDTVVANRIRLTGDTTGLPANSVMTKQQIIDNINARVGSGGSGSTIYASDGVYKDGDTVKLGGNTTYNDYTTYKLVDDKYFALTDMAENFGLDFSTFSGIFNTTLRGGVAAYPRSSITATNTGVNFGYTKTSGGNTLTLQVNDGGANFSEMPDTSLTTPTHLMTEQQVKREIAAADDWKETADGIKYESGTDSFFITTNGLRYYAEGNNIFTIDKSEGESVLILGDNLAYNTQMAAGIYMIMNNSEVWGDNMPRFGTSLNWSSGQYGMYINSNDTIKFGRYFSIEDRRDYFYSTKSGSIGIVSNGVRTFEVDSNGMIKNAFTPHAQSTFADSSITIDLVQNEWVQITRPGAKTTWPTTEFYGFTDSGDTIVSQYSGHYIANYDINITGIDNKVYEYRLMQKNGTTKEAWKYKVSGTGTIVLRNISSYLDLEPNSLFWIEIRCTSLAPGSVTVYGGRMTVRPVHLNL